MPTMDTILAQVTNSAAVIAATVAAGDTLTVRNFQAPSEGLLEGITVKGGQATTVRILSPYFHDTTRGITYITAQAPTERTIPRQAPQRLVAQDVLQLQGNSGAANSSIFALHNYYTDLGASGARLHSWGDIAGLIAEIKPVEVDCTASATIGAWSDTAVTATENLLKANTDYAVLGYMLDVAVGVIAIKGQDTGNLRCGAPGSVLTDTSSEYFIRQTEETGRPHIPVINAANVNNTVVSVADNAASTAVRVQLILAELSSNLSS